MRTTTIAAALCAAALLVSGCGGGDDTRTDASEATPTEETSETTLTAGEDPAFTEADAEAVIQEYFDAQRAGDAAAICALEDPLLQGSKYGEPGQPCLDDLANNTEQVVWAEDVTIVSLEVSEFGVDAVLQPNASTPDEAVLTLMPDDDGNLLVTRFQ